LAASTKDKIDWVKELVMSLPKNPEKELGKNAYAECVAEETRNWRNMSGSCPSCHHVRERHHLLCDERGWEIFCETCERNRSRNGHYDTSPFCRAIDSINKAVINRKAEWDLDPF
jgi:hypothetical protein